MIDITPKYSVIVSVFNSEETIHELMDRIDATMKAYLNYELIFIDDFSEDDSWNQLIKAKKDRSHIRLIRLTKNFGQAKVLLCGINESKADILISIDDDLQYPPEEITKLIENFNPNKQYILFGVPEQRGDSYLKKIASNTINSILNKSLLQSEKKLKFSSFRIFTKKTHNRNKYNETSMRNVQIFFQMVSPKLMDYIYVKHENREKGRSSYTFFKRIKIGFELLITTSSLPEKVVKFNALVCLFFLLLTLISLSLFSDFTSLIFKIFVPILFLLISLVLTILFYYSRKIFLENEGGNNYSIWEEC